MKRKTLALFIALALPAFALSKAFAGDQLSGGALRGFLSGKTLFATNLSNKKVWNVYFSKGGVAYFRYASGNFGIAQWSLSGKEVCFTFAKSPITCKTVERRSDGSHDWRDAQGDFKVTSVISSTAAGDVLNFIETKVEGETNVVPLTVSTDQSRAKIVAPKRKDPPPPPGTDVSSGDGCSESCHSRY